MSAGSGTRHRVPVQPVTFPRAVRAEWIKLWSLRSTYWAMLATLAVMVLIALVIGLASLVGEAATGVDGELAIGMGYSFAQLVVAVLGVLTITGEYSTGLIRSTLAAVPTRLPVLGAKALVLASVGFGLGLLGVALSYLASYPLVGAAGAATVTDPQVLRIFWGTGLYLGAVGLLGLGVGALLRHTAGAVAVILGVLLLLPSLWQLLMLTSDWFVRSYGYLPSTAGERIASPQVAETMAEGPAVLGPWVGFAVLLVYVGVTLAAAAALLVRRDA